MNHPEIRRTKHRRTRRKSTPARISYFRPNDGPFAHFENTSQVIDSSTEPWSASKPKIGINGADAPRLKLRVFPCQIFLIPLAHTLSPQFRCVRTKRSDEPPGKRQSESARLRIPAAPQKHRSAPVPISRSAQENSRSGIRRFPGPGRKTSVRAAPAASRNGRTGVRPFRL